MAKHNKKRIYNQNKRKPITYDDWNTAIQRISNVSISTLQSFIREDKEHFTDNPQYIALIGLYQGKSNESETPLQKHFISEFRFHSPEALTNGAFYGHIASHLGKNTNWFQLHSF